MIIGAHSIIYSTNPDADRAFLRDVLELPNVDVGHGWLIFGLPPAEVAVHPFDKNDVHEFYLMCDDIAALVADMKTRGVVCGSGAGRRLGCAHAADAARRRKARHLSAAARATAKDERVKGTAATGCAPSRECRLDDVRGSGNLSWIRRISIHNRRPSRRTDS